MKSATQFSGVSKGSLWAGRIISGLIVLFLLFDSSVKLLRAPAALDGSAQLGYSLSVVFPIGVVLLGSVLLYIVPRTSILGAILLTGYLGGATATHVRVLQLWFCFPIVFGILTWLGLWLRSEQLRALIPLRNQ